ncbi:MAG: hypothetical protein V3R94_01630, partial [Acidobacteriota bacterium]
MNRFMNHPSYNGIPMGMKKHVLFLLSALCFTALGAQADLKPEEIIERFAAMETEFKGLWQQYTYTQKIVFQVLDERGEIQEEREMWVEVYFTKEGKRETRILDDRGRLRSVRVSQEDIDDAVHRQPFVLTTEDLPLYRVDYRGEEQVDELYTYVFDVEPIRIQDGKRYFEGRIWVDDLDFQIVRSVGKVVPDYRDNKFPKFETLRQQVDGEHWFPVWTEADDVLRFGRGNEVRVRELITYDNFQKFEVNTSIRYEPIEGQ